MATLNLGRIKPVFRGAYAGGTAYVVDDIVTSGNETFICILASTGNATSNATYWTKLAAKGTDGTDVGTTLTTQGDILFRDGSGLQRLAKGTAGQVLKINSGATAPEWGTDVGGKIGQVLGAVDDAERSTTSSSWVTASNTLQVTITPAATSSKFFIFAHTMGFDSSGQHKAYSLFRDSTNLGHATYGLQFDEGYDRIGYVGLSYLDSPNTTSAVVYGVRMRTNSNTIYMQRGGGGTYNAHGHITVMEVLA